jgi:hypothetical protein
MANIDASETKYWTAPGISGPWTTNLVSVIAPGNTKKDSWSTQCDFVFTFKGSKDTVFMYDGDRWLKPELTRQGDYAWLPITFSPKDSVILDYYQDWEVEPDLGLWRPLDRKRDLALGKTASASSNSTTANNVTDASTYQNYLNTRWTSAASDPQWLTIDLGSAMPVNRVILKWDSACAKTFKIQVSADTATWKDVYVASKVGVRSVTDETFPTTTARYVRMYGTERTTTSKGYSMFEFMVLSDSVTVSTSTKPGKPAAALSALLTFENNTVRYHVPLDNSVKLDLVDGRGRAVAMLVDGFKRAGDHKAVLPAAVRNGAYVVRLTLGGGRMTTARIIVR